MIESKKAEYPIVLMCRLLGCSRSGYYARRSREPSLHAQEDQRLLKRIREAHQAGRGTYGSPRVHRELKRLDEPVGRHRVARLMREHGITARTKRRFRKTTDSAHDKPIAANHLARAFTASEPNRAWTGDITYIWTRQGWLYLAVLLDLFSRRIVGWSMSETLQTELAMGALRMALGRRQIEPGLLHHSDRGCQYASDAYQAELAKAGIVCSMSRKGNCWDSENGASRSGVKSDPC